MEMSLKDLFKRKNKKEKKKKEDQWEIDQGSDHPVHEKYTKEEIVKE